MMKDVVISVHSIHGYDREDADVIDFTTDGLYTLDGDTACITYMESEVTGLEGTRTSVMVMPDQVVVDRDGTITSRMIFREGEKTSFQYDTPYGAATLGIDARKIEHSFDENSGSMDIEMVMDMEHAIVSLSRISVTVKAQNFGGMENG